MTAMLTHQHNLEAQDFSSVKLPQEITISANRKQSCSSYDMNNNGTRLVNPESLSGYIALLDAEYERGLRDNEWTKQETIKIVELAKEHHCNWDFISKLIGGPPKTPLACSNRYNQIIEYLQRKGSVPSGHPPGLPGSPKDTLTPKLEAKTELYSPVPIVVTGNTGSGLSVFPSSISSVCTTAPPSYRSPSSIPLPSTPKAAMPPGSSNNTPQVNSNSNINNNNINKPIYNANVNNKKRKKSSSHLSKSVDGKKRRMRRTAAEIERNYKCEMPNCAKAYGSEGALKMHIKLKHPNAKNGNKSTCWNGWPLMIKPVNLFGFPQFIVGNGNQLVPLDPNCGVVPGSPNLPGGRGMSPIAPAPTRNDCLYFPVYLNSRRSASTGALPSDVDCLSDDPARSVSVDVMDDEHNHHMMTAQNDDYNGMNTLDNNLMPSADMFKMPHHMYMYPNQGHIDNQELHELEQLAPHTMEPGMLAGDSIFGLPAMDPSAQYYHKGQNGYDQELPKPDPLLKDPLLSIKIGTFERIAQYPGEVVAVFNVDEGVLDWEMATNNGLLKIRTAFPDVSGFGLELPPDGSAILTVELKKPPSFQSYENGQWVACHDFTGSEASICKRHVLHFAKGVLNDPLEHLLSSNERFKYLAQLGLPSLEDPYFTTYPVLNSFDMSNMDALLGEAGHLPLLNGFD
eukprot:TRINITY_DN6287_c0_g1_i1.p1 TRINITY_DN6287_c0_g1~~TRINITY_DN6287_c0_g1_i1.p1  ORF type:complete len:681 (-),score=149.37 TRINITY_DN6287_c0_g1_i1:165-2207(-)